MNSQKKILSYCPKFNEIVNCDFLEDDVLTQRIIQYYQDYVFSIEANEENAKMLEALDRAVYRYIEDYRFAKSLRETLDVDIITGNDFSYFGELMKYIIQYFDEYDEKTMIDIAPTRWI